ncbi:MAG TPA: heat-inducible transcriptional repressor HrcA [Actinomycetota bacterium]|nr:heat-inducible transcriptional repressor HrcA [Actinomycetota bacterium]
MVQPSSLPSLDSRKATVLRAVVREYVRAGQPVGSRTLSERYRLKVSAATIRNDMAVLEELGFISQPHTSAGRIPTDLGYRWFLDNWPGVKWPELPTAEQQAISAIGRVEYAGLDEALRSASQVLSDVTDATAVVAGPPTQKNRLRRLELLQRPDGRATLLLIADTGVVKQGVTDVPAGLGADQLEDMGRQLSGALEGVSFDKLASQMVDEDEDESAKASKRKELKRSVAKEVTRIIQSSSEERIYRGGTAHILSPDKFQDIQTAHNVVEALESPPLLGELLDRARQSPAVLVFIGREVPIEEMQACAVVFSPYEVDHETVGSLGVIGPTRMDYPHTISAVAAAARSLSKLLEDEERG